MQVFATQDVSEAPLQRFASRLRPTHVVDVDERRAFFKSAEPPSWVHVLQTPEFWLTTLAGNLAWDATKELIRNRARIREDLRGIVTGALLDFAVAVASLREEVAKETAIWIGCPIPNDWFSTLLLIQSGVPEDIATEVALFLLHMPALERFLEDHAHRATGQITLTLTEDGSMDVAWMDGATLSSHVTHLSLPDVA